jgi:phage host-nuclease inhibitor protein Gam
MSKKDKIIPMIVTTREGMLSAVAEHVNLKLQHAELSAQMEQEKLSVEKRYQSRLVNLGMQIEASFAGIQLWAERNAAEFGDKKSIDATVAVVGFRTTPFRVDKQRGKDTWENIALRLQSVFDDKFVRTPAPVVDKEALLSDRLNLTEEQLRQVGVRFERDETFYIEPKSAVVAKTTELVA